MSSSLLTGVCEHMLRQEGLRLGQCLLDEWPRVAAGLEKEGVGDAEVGEALMQWRWGQVLKYHFRPSALPSALLTVV